MTTENDVKIMDIKSTNQTNNLSTTLKDIFVTL